MTHFLNNKQVLMENVLFQDLTLFYIEIPVLLSLFFYILLEVKGDSLTLSLALIKEYITGFHTV